MIPELKQLLGAWTAISAPGSVGPAGAQGGWEFRSELDGKVIVRKNWAVYSSPEGGGVVRHTDLLAVYEAPNGETRAIYWDSEGHVIPYVVRLVEDPKRIEFSSDPSVAGPTYRLTYTLGGPDEVTGKFEVRQPSGQRFQTYLEWRGVRAPNKFG